MRREILLCFYSRLPVDPKLSQVTVSTPLRSIFLRALLTCHLRVGLELFEIVHTKA